MKKCNLTLLGLILMFISCNNGIFNEEEETFQSLDMDVIGIDLQKEAGVYIGEVDSSAVEFTITGKGKYVDVVYVTSVMVDGIMQEKEGDLGGEPPFLDTYPKLEGDWGKISYLTTKPPYTMQFQLSKNQTHKKRIFEFQLGFGYWYDIVRIIQGASNY